MKKNILVKLVILFLMICTIVHSMDASRGAAAGIAYSLNVLIPSLFPFMVLSGMLSGVYVSFSPFLTYALSVLGGYPVGINMISKAGDKAGREKLTEYLTYVCINPGISFMIIVVGNTLLQNIKAALLIIISVYLSSLLLFLSVIFLFGKHNEIKKHSLKSKRFEAGLIESVYSASKSMLMICALAVIFSSFIYLLYSFKAGEALHFIMKNFGFQKGESYSLLSGLLEISGGITDAAVNGCSIYFMTFILAFGGVCVHFQIFSLLKGKVNISYLKFYLFRIIHSLLSVLILFILRNVIKIDVVTVSMSDPPQTMGGAFLPGTAALIIMAVIFILSIKKDMEIIK